MSTETIFGDDDQEDVPAESGSKSEEESGDVPVFANSNIGAAAWINQGRQSGDAYIRVQAPLIDGFNLYVPDSIQDLFNQFAEQAYEELQSSRGGQ